MRIRKAKVSWLQCVALGILSLGSVTGASLAEGPVVVGWVERVEGDFSTVQWTRGDKLLQLELYGMIMRGDRFAVLDAKTSIDLRLGSNRVIVTGADSPYEVKEERQTSSRIAQIMQSAASWFKVERQHTNIPVHVRNVCDLGVPLIHWKGSWLARGKRALSLEWSGGEPPFRVSLTSTDEQGKNETHLLGETPASAATWKTVLDPGRYILMITYENNCRYTGNVNVVEIDRVPRAEFDARGVPEPVRITLEAYELAKADNGSWALEAYQMLVPIAGEHPPAAFLKSLLASGRLPSD